MKIGHKEKRTQTEFKKQILMNQPRTKIDTE